MGHIVHISLWLEHFTTLWVEGGGLDLWGWWAAGVALELWGWWAGGVALELWGWCAG